MSSRLRRRVLRSEARVASLGMELREEKAKLARLQLRYSRQVREETSSDSSSGDSSSGEPSAKRPPLALDNAQEQPSSQGAGASVEPSPMRSPLALADTQKQQPPLSVAAEAKEERKRQILLFADADGKPTGGSCRRCRLWLQGAPGGPPHIFDSQHGVFG